MAPSELIENADLDVALINKKANVVHSQGSADPEESRLESIGPTDSRPNRGSRMSGTASSLKEQIIN